MCVECGVESLVLEDDHENVPNGRHRSATLLREGVRRGGSDSSAGERRREKELFAGSYHETKGRSSKGATGYIAPKLR